MFEGVSDQLHQFISRRTTTTTSSLPLNFPLNYNFHPFDSFNALQPHIQSPTLKKEPHSHHDTNFAMDSDHQWTNDEVLALLRIRSNMENWFPESIWEHVSRKLGEVGFRRTAEKCKEKFEEETTYFNNINKTSRFLTSDLYQDQPLFHGKPNEVLQQENKPLGQENKEEEEEDSRNVEETESKSCYQKKKKKRRLMRQKEFEMLKAFCEDVVKKMMAQQEEIHTKLLHEMLKREEEKIAKEESWKKQQMESLHKELEIMAQEQALAGDRQVTIIEILNQITNSTNFPSFQARKELKILLQSLNASSPSSSSLIQGQTSSPTCDYDKNKKQALASSAMVLPPHENSSSFTSQNDPIIKIPNPIKLLPTSSSTHILSPQDPNSFINHQKTPSNPASVSIQKLTQNPKSNEKESDDLGKRWPRDEVLALLNVRCSLYGNGSGDQESGEGSSKAPLWERISQGMLELGYKRSAKRCKEKWENINKYFRKTRDVNKKRSLDSRTCPYFHQLSTLYNQGGSNLGASTTVKRPENCSNSSENHSELSETLPNSSQRSLMHVNGG